MIRKRIGLFWFMMCGTVVISAQTGGNSVYNFLNFSYSPRLSALGNNLISVHDEDATLLIMNPSSIGLRHHNSLSLDFTDYFTNSNCASALYSYTFPKVGSFAVEFRWVGYGSFTGTDATGNETGKFSAGDYAFTLGWGRQLNPHFSIGANLKLIFCQYESYNSFGLAVDVAGSYYNEAKKLSLTLLAKNIGSELKNFTPGNFERLPFDLQFALSQRLAHIPVRYHISLHSLYRWNMSYYGKDNPFLESDAITGKLKYPTGTTQFFDNMFRHVVVGLEIEPIKYFSIQFAYNHNIHQEMKLVSRYTMAGFSYGFMLNFDFMQIGFSRLHYAVGATPNYFSLTLNFDKTSNVHRNLKTKKLIKKSNLPPKESPKNVRKKTEQ